MTRRGWILATKVFMVAVLAAGILYDVVVYNATQGGGPATISQVTLRQFSIYPILPLALGILIGHLTWPQAFPTQETRDVRRQPH